MFERHRIAELLLRCTVLRFELFQQKLKACQHIFICRLLPRKAVLVLNARLREDALLFLEILFILRHNAARSLFELLLDARILLRMEQHAHEVAALFRVRHQECAEFALRQQHDLPELAGLQAEQRLDLLRDLVRLRPCPDLVSLRIELAEFRLMLRRLEHIIVIAFLAAQPTADTPGHIAQTKCQLHEAIG